MADDSIIFRGPFLRGRGWGEEEEGAIISL